MATRTRARARVATPAGSRWFRAGSSALAVLPLAALRLPRFYATCLPTVAASAAAARYMRARASVGAAPSPPRQRAAPGLLSTMNLLPATALPEKLYPYTRRLTPSLPPYCSLAAHAGPPYRSPHYPYLPTCRHRPFTYCTLPSPRQHRLDRTGCRVVLPGATPVSVSITDAVAYRLRLLQRLHAALTPR